jgi:prepilin-type N-terminal cleavage/methylation domain-containing protein
MQQANIKKGFTLLELLIVIAIIAILSVVLVLVLNPAETLKKSRDAQRISDMSSLKTALGLYITAVASPSLNTAVANLCLTGSNAQAQIGYSYTGGQMVCAGAAPAKGADAVSGSSFSASDWCYNATTTASSTVIDGSGWLPVNLTQITGGSPISNLPLDPTNTVGTPSAPTSLDYVYRYACQSVGDTTHPSYVYEIDAVLESDTYKAGGSDDKSAKDGGDNVNYYEVGTSLRLIGGGTNF